MLLDDEINPVIRKLEERGIELSALHLLYENPRIMYIHFVGRGNEVEMTKGIWEALALTKSPLVSTPASPEAKPELAKEIEWIIGYEGITSTSQCPATTCTCTQCMPPSPAAWA